MQFAHYFLLCFLLIVGQQEHSTWLLYTSILPHTICLLNYDSISILIASEKGAQGSFSMATVSKKGLKEFQEVITLYEKGRLKQPIVNYEQIV